MIKHEQNENISVCRMCKQPCLKFAKSHIVPRGFFKNENGERGLLSFHSDGDGRKLPDGIYDSTILCPECEERLKKYDTRACEVLFQCKNAQTINVGLNRSVLVFTPFSATDRWLLRGFLSSLLWRMSITEQKEFASVDIGDHYQERIAEDILNDGKFSYVDACVSRYETLENFRIETPQKDRVKGINVFWVKLPYLSLLVSLDKRKHPYVSRYKLQMLGIPLVSTSLSETENDIPFGIAVTPTALGNRQECFDIVSAFDHNRQTFLQSNQKHSR